MKISEITLDQVKNALKVDFTEDDDYISNILMPAAKSHITSYTGLTADVADTKEDLSIAYLVLIGDMYENREYIVKDNKVNRVIETILNKYCINLL